MPKVNSKPAPSNGRVISLDFEGVESGGGRVRIPEGGYGFEITKIEMKKGKDSEEPYLKFHLKTFKGNSKGLNKTLTHICTLQKQGLWNFRNLLEAAGKQVPSSVVKINVDKLVGLQLAGDVVDEEYEGKNHSVIGSFFPVADLGSTKETVTEDEQEEQTEEASGEVEEEAEELFS